MRSRIVCGQIPSPQHSLALLRLPTRRWPGRSQRNRDGRAMTKMRRPRKIAITAANATRFAERSSK